MVAAYFLIPMLMHDYAGNVDARLVHADSLELQIALLAYAECYARLTQRGRTSGTYTRCNIANEPTLDEMSFGRWARYRRHALGLTRADVAARAGMAQSNLAAIDAGRRSAEPRTVARLRATLSARPSILFDRNRAAILDAARRHRVTNGRVFGSVARGEDRPCASDVDLLVELPKDDAAAAYLESADEAARILTVPVDVVPDRGSRADRVLTAARREAAAL
ncbi:nucleotidyltransferase domain-containing protein [Georgenia sp. TF02-10]|uniref:nucleotidyltransferase domain-containing protein n=1 Tax=Georgenia sp. TF02-10 TaxID=2917725 RepID=UPI001FA7AC94|nr:nucleotidyltransferase domain-containing protein [Georgenia sp. TF02-10]UNX56220.1 nucleotidyltransferase domain-containing protein [Georgenia sp. TF02-10]